MFATEVHVAPRIPDRRVRHPPGDIPGESAAGSASIIPAPRQIQAGSGTFHLDRTTQIMLSDPASTELRTLVELLAAPLRTASGLLLPLSPHPADDRPDAISLRVTPQAGSAASGELPAAGHPAGSVDLRSHHRRPVLGASNYPAASPAGAGSEASPGLNPDGPSPQWRSRMQPRFPYRGSCSMSPDGFTHPSSSRS